jgi:hypothetical protein
MEDAEWAATIRETLAKENREGGDLKGMLCPFCGKPRSPRSDYIRCQPCGVNWLEGEDVNRDPRTDRYRKMVEHLSLKLTTPKTA